MKLEVIVNGSSGELQLDAARFHYSRDGSVAEGDFSVVEGDFSIVATSPGAYSVFIGDRSYEVIIASPGMILVNSREFSVEVFDPREFRARSRGASSAGRQNVSALMPGKVVRLLAAIGDPVDAGQGLIVVEAMKMQNEMKSPKAGHVVEVRTEEGATVAAGDVLVVIE